MGLVVFSSLIPPLFTSFQLTQLLDAPIVNVTQQTANFDATQLAAELATLQEALAERISDPQHYIEIGAVVEAQNALGSGEESKAIDALKKVGKWTADTATAIGTRVAAEVIKSHMGLS